MVKDVAIYLLLAISAIVSGSVKYPITASWFKDRFTSEEWDAALDEFAAQGGDTVWLRAQPVVIRSREDLQRDPSFVWCGSYKSSTGVLGTPCYDEAVEELQKLGLKVSTFLTYNYEENFSNAIMLCPQYDRKIQSSRIYYRIVLPLEKPTGADPCALPRNSSVAVLFTSFAGTDPHELLVTSARKRNMSVYFGLPSYPTQAGEGFVEELDEAYHSWVQRVLVDHEHRYGHSVNFPADRKETRNSFEEYRNKGKSPTLSGKEKHMKNRRKNKPLRFRGKERIGIGNTRSSNQQHQPPFSSDLWKILTEHKTIQTFSKDDTETLRKSTKKSNSSFRSSRPYDTIIGYYSTDECCLGQLTNNSHFLPLYKRLGSSVHSFNQTFVVSPYVDLNRAQINLTLEQHVQGFEFIARLGVVDVIAVQEGRGAGKGCYYWDTEVDSRVDEIDPMLDRIIRYINPDIRKGVTYREAFTSSNQQVFRAFSELRDNLFKQGNRVELWLNVEAFEYLRDDPCLPVDIQGSGMAELLDRTSKNRLDRALTVAGAFTQKIISFAWDSDYLCVTKGYNESLAQSIRRDYGQPIISNCSFHSAQNQSVVLLGYNLDGETQKFQVNYPTKQEGRKQVALYGYYFELDYGLRHDRVPQLQYTQLYDIPETYTDLATKGFVQVMADGSNNYCIFTFDYS